MKEMLQYLLVTPTVLRVLRHEHRSAQRRTEAAFTALMKWAAKAVASMLVASTPVTP